ncbi:MAG: dipeptidase, partial [Aggregatilineales bacterium]
VREAMAMTALLFDIEHESEGQVKVVRTVSDIEYCLENDVLATILHFEGADPIDEDLNSLDVFYQAGLRSLGIVWSRPNVFGHGVPFGFNRSPDTGDGLTRAGKRLVRRCNELGIMIDLSHLNEKGFRDVAKISDAPLVATHSNVHAITPVTRNLTDEQLAIIKDSDGMVGLNFAVYFLDENGEKNEDLPLETMRKHLDYLIGHLGEERVGLGSDFDGAHITQRIGDVAGLPKLVEVLREGGYDDDLLEKLLYKNWLRVLRKTWK